MSRPIRFGVAAHAVDGADTWRALARRVESQGYATLLLPDHTNPQLSPIPALVAAAAVTTTLRVGTQVLCNDLRNPTMTAKEVATLDVLAAFADVAARPPEEPDLVPRPRPLRGPEHDRDRRRNVDRSAPL